MKWSKITISEHNKKRLMGLCVDEYLFHHPEFRKVKLTQDFILEKVIDFYLNN